jgi:hypothetical protein
VMTYLGLLYQDLIRQKALPPSGFLPPVFLAVLYNGERPWQAALDVADLIGPVPEGLDAYRPRLRYVLFDELRLPELPGEERENLAAALFRLEQAREPEDFGEKVNALGELVRANPDLRRSFTTWLTRVLLPSRFPGLRFPEIQDLQEIQTMGLAERVMEWTREWKEEGRQEGVRAFQDFLLSEMVERFGPVPPAIRRRVESVQDPDELKKLGKRLLAATSLDDLRF